MANVPDDDIIVTMDAFDVLLFSDIKNIGEVLSNSETPIIFCAEYGVYPNLQGKS